MKNPCWYSNLTLSTSLRRVRGTKKFAEGLFQTSRESRELYCLPYFFLAGFPKCGTTTLHEALQQHPQITGPTRKEPHWWTRVRLKDMNTDYLKLTVMKYLHYFTGVAEEYSKEGMVTYDATQSTLWDSNFYLDNEDYCATPAILSRILPNAKFIVLMRNPVTREYSDFFYFVDEIRTIGLNNFKRIQLDNFSKNLKLIQQLLLTVSRKPTIQCTSA